VPDYDGACLANVVPALADPQRAPDWVPDVVRMADAVVLLVLDGLGWSQLQARPDVAPTLSSMDGAAIDSVAPTTTSTALTSIATGSTPAEHGVVAYRMHLPGEGVLNVLRWTAGGGDARVKIPPSSIQPSPAFGGRSVPVITKAEFRGSGFSDVQGLRRIVGWHAASSIAVEVGEQLRAGERFVYAYYEGVDRVAHACGFGAFYDAELAAADRLVASIVDALPSGCALVVTSDHGQVDVGVEGAIPLAKEVLDACSVVSGEARFTWLHAKRGAAGDVAEMCRSLYGDVADVFVRDELVDGGWFGPVEMPDVVRSRLGDVAVLARAPVALLDPADPGSAALRCRHGSLTPDELKVPLLAIGSTA
jgi:hypothetical protein